VTYVVSGSATPMYEEGCELNVVRGRRADDDGGVGANDVVAHNKESGMQRICVATILCS